MKKKQIVNIINFIRGCEPRREIDLLKPVREQIRLMKELHLKGTFLIQYDALIMPEFAELLKTLDPKQFEIGVWFEITQPQTEAVGIEWKGRFPWDWHVHCDFPVGYVKEDREKLVDVLYQEFKKTFGYYPRVFGSWFFDTHTIRYISDQYGCDALCNCKEQYGTDGYTLWGGYYGQAYYPSCNNVFMPAQSEATQIPVPLFRMLGPDQVYQYDFGLQLDSEEEKWQPVITLEPACKGIGGSDPKWIDWFLRENFNGECLSFGYAQAGQENSFGWEGMEKGLTYQFEQFAKLQQEGLITVETMGESGRWFQDTYRMTPASAVTAHSAYDDVQKKTVWYSSRYYRINLYGEKGLWRIRDLHLFSEKYPDPFEDRICTANEATYDTLPFIDGNRMSGNGILAGGYIIYEDGTAPWAEEMEFVDCDGGRAKVSCGELTVELAEESIRITASKPFTLENRIGVRREHCPEMVSCDRKKLTLSYEGLEYTVQLTQGSFVTPVLMRSEGNVLELLLAE